MKGKPTVDTIVLSASVLCLKVYRQGRIEREGMQLPIAIDLNSIDSEIISVS